jgi:hypothetical protein
MLAEHNLHDNLFQLLRTSNSAGMNCYKCQGVKAKEPFLCSSDSIGEKFLHPSFKYFPPVTSDEVDRELDFENKGIFSNLHLRSLFSLAREEDTDANLREKENEEIAEKDEIIDRLTFQVSQRDNIIKNLENLVMMQQNVLAANYLSSEEKASNEERNTSVEERDLQEEITGFKKKLEERKKRREFLKQRRFYLSSEEKFSSEEKNSSIEERDLQEVINGFQKKHAERKKKEGVLNAEKIEESK